MKKMENNYAFVDSQNVNLGVQSLGWKIDVKDKEGKTEEKVEEKAEEKVEEK